MNLSKKVMPSAVEVEGVFYTIHTAHFYWFRFAELIKQNPALTDFDFLYKDEIPPDREKGFASLTEFFAPKKELPRTEENDKSTEIALDYTIDADLIYSSILEQYGIDLFEKEIHWHKVRAMIDGLHGTKLNDIIQARLYKRPSKNDSYEKSMLALQKAWRIEAPLTAEEKAASEKFDALLNAVNVK